jgi:hypothetical protein
LKFAVPAGYRAERQLARRIKRVTYRSPTTRPSTKPVRSQTGARVSNTPSTLAAHDVVAPSLPQEPIGSFVRAARKV